MSSSEPRPEDTQPADQPEPNGDPQEQDAAARMRPYDLFMFWLCVYVLVAQAASNLAQLSPNVVAVLQYIDTGVCVLFLADFFWSLAVAEDRWQYMKWGWIDLISSIPTLDALRWGRFARIIRILRVLRGVKSFRVLMEYILKRRGEAAFTAAALVSILVTVYSSIAILEVETTEESNIQSPEDAVWWSFVTITTVGYGDKYPVTPEGRLLAAALMIAGVGLFGTFTGFIASWFLEPKEQATESELELLHAELAEVRRLLEDLHARQTQ